MSNRQTTLVNVHSHGGPSQMMGFFHDLRFAGRSVLRTPWFAGIAVLTLALGIGLNTALFSMVDAVVLRAMPYKDPDRLVEIWGQEGTNTGMRVPAPLVEALQARSRTLQTIAIHGPVGGVFRASDGLLDIRGDHVSANFVDVMGVPPLLGRGFLPGEDRAGAPPVLLVSYNFWQRHLGGDSAAIGRVLYLDNLAFTVIGVMPPEFRTHFSENIRQDYWTNYVSERTRQFELEEGYELIARLAPAATLEAARSELRSIASSVQLAGWREQGRRLGLAQIKNEVVGDSAHALKLMLGAVGIVLIVVCSNLALLLLARSDKRVNEFATRKAIGAGAAQLFRLALTESLVIAVAGGLAGVAIAYSVLPLMLALAPSEIPRIGESAVNIRALAVALACTLITGCAFGLAPAIRLSQVTLLQAMKRSSGRASARNSWLRGALVSGQVAASLALSIMAGLVGRTFLTLLPSEPGFDPKELSTFSLYLPSAIYPTSAGRARVQEEMVRRVGLKPGVTGVAFAENIPFSEDALSVAVSDDRAAPSDSTNLTADVRAVSANYHQLLRIPLRRGRAFTPRDRQGSAVAIVNETLARRLAKNGDVLGRVVRVGRPATARTYEIVGVAADTRSHPRDLDILNEVHVPFTQRGSSFGFLIVQSRLDAGQLTQLLRREIRQAAPDLPLLESKTALTMSELMRRSLAGPRFTATLATTSSLIAMLLAAMGVFGLVSYTVAQRRHEFGIRSALGARPRDLAMSAMRSALVLSTSGVAIGLAVAALLTRFVESQLYAVEPFNAPTFVGAGLLILTIAGLAAAIPARQTLRIDPMATLR